MFNLAVSPSYRWPIKGKIPGGIDEKGVEVFQEFSFVAVLKRVDQKRIEEIQARFKVESEVIFEREIAREVMMGWEDVNNGGVALEFNSENLEKMISIAAVAKTIFIALVESIGGSVRKN